MRKNSIYLPENSTAPPVMQYFMKKSLPMPLTLKIAMMHIIILVTVQPLVMRA